MKAPILSYDEVIAMLAQVRKAIIPISHKGNLSYAIAYLNAVRENEEQGAMMGYTKEQSLQTQVLYILNNLGAWSGPEAKAMKTGLKAFSMARLS